jgi:hypothetical protein
MPWPDAKTYTEKIKMDQGKSFYEIGDPIHNPLLKLEALEKNNQFTVSVGPDGKSGTLELPGRDGKPEDLPIGQAPPAPAAVEPPKVEAPSR